MLKIICSLVLVLWFSAVNPGAPASGAEVIKLPPPSLKGTVSVEEALQGRRSNREFAARSLELAQVAQLLWAADGVNNPQGKRTAPAARAAYAVDLYLVAGERGVANLAPGLYRYLVSEQALELVAKGEFRPAVAKACNSQAWMAEAPVLVAIAGDYARCAGEKWGQGPHVHPLRGGLCGAESLSGGGRSGVGGRHRRGLQ